MKLLSLLGALLAAVTCAECVTVCYYGSWARTRPGNGKVVIEDIDPHMCTHLVYAFVGVDSENGVITVLDPWADLCAEDHVDGGLCGFQRFNDRKKQNPDLKTLLAVGGWNEGSKDFSIVASDEEKRKSFVDSALVLLKAHNFDGLDMDWEYPGSRNGSSSDDKANFITLLSELRLALSPEGKMLTAAVAAGQDTIEKAYDIPAMSTELDYIFLMAYDMFGPWDNFTHHNAPLYVHPLDTGNDKFTNVDYSVQYWLDQGAPPEKLVLGLGMYGRCWSLSSNTPDPGFYTPAYEHGPPGPYTKASGFLGYNELCEKQKNENWIVSKDSTINETYAYYDDGEQVVWCGYDDEESIRTKALYAQSLDLGGVMVWSLETDDVHGICNSGKFPLIKAADQVFHDKEPAERVMTCYYASWAIYRTEATRPGAVFPVDLAALTDVCTHLIYAFAGVDDTTGEIKVLDANADLGSGEGGQWDGYKIFTDLAKDTYSLNALIAVGGAGSAKIFSKMAADTELRGNFVNSVLTFITKYNFDGLDMDWEFPETAEDKVNFVSLLSELDQALHAQGHLLTVAVPINKTAIDVAYDVPSISGHVDLIHVMTYDYHGAWDKHLHHNAPLYKHHSDYDDTLTVNFSINYWIEKGAPVDKLVLGLPLYGRCWTLNDTSEHDILDLGSPSPPGPISGGEGGVLFYNEICKSQMDNSDWVIFEDEEMKVPYGYSLSADNLWCGYDDQTSISLKATFSNTLGLRGMMIWTVDEDDAHNQCGLSSGNFRDSSSSSVNFPLTRKAKEVFNNPLTTAAPTTDPTTTPAETTAPSTTISTTTVSITTTIASTTSDMTTDTATDTTISSTTKLTSSDSTSTEESTTSSPTASDISSTSQTTFTTVPNTATSDSQESTTTATTATTEMTETTSAAFFPTPSRGLAIISTSLLMMIVTNLII